MSQYQQSWQTQIIPSGTFCPRCSVGEEHVPLKRFVTVVVSTEVGVPNGLTPPHRMQHGADVLFCEECTFVAPLVEAHQRSDLLVARGSLPPFPPGPLG